MSGGAPGSGGGGKRGAPPSSTRLGRLDAASLMASSQNLPAVLNDPGRGKQRDFFTRSWGDSFADGALNSPHPQQGPDVSARSFERYLRKLRRHRGRRQQQQQLRQQQQQQDEGPSSPSASPKHR